MEKKLDRRVRRTRRLLRDALIELVIERGYDDIKIHEITDRADVSRATFYLHFATKEDLLISSLREIYDELVTRMEPLTKENLLTGTPASLIAFQHAAENRNLYKILLNGHGSGVVLQQEREYLAKTIIEQMLRLTPLSERGTPFDLLANHMAGSLMGLLIWWLENDLPHPPEYMAEMYRQLHLPVVMQYFDVNVNTAGV